MLKAFFDDSGTHEGSEVVVVGGLIGTLDQWEAFDADWNAKLAEPLPGKPKLRKFHLSACRAADDEFRDYTPAERDAVTHDFREILIKHRLIATASAVDAMAWNELIAGEARHWLGDAINVCIDNCMQEAIKIADAHPLGEGIIIVFDQGICTERIKQQTDEYTFPLGRPRVVSVKFMSVEDCVGLQGADIPATENYWYALEFLKTGGKPAPRPHMKHFLGNMFAEGLMVTRESLSGRMAEVENLIAKQRFASE